MAQQQKVSSGEYKEIFTSRQFYGSGMFNFSIPIPGSKRIPHPHRSIFNPKKCFQALGNMMFISNPDLDFLPIPDPGVKKAPDPQHCFTEVLVTNTVTHLLIIEQQTLANRKSQIL
jgi:hypothetical protein